MQSQVDVAHGQDFPDLLRALLRHAPDVVMVGEIRDTETAQVAVQAATSGQLVFATVHAPTAAQAVFTMLQLNVNRHVLAGAINGVIAQDMRHTPCRTCATKIEGSDEVALAAAREILGADFAAEPIHGEGCEDCDQLGYRGQTAIFEVLNVTPEVRELIRKNGSPTAMQSKAVEQGMITLETSEYIAFAKGLAARAS